MCRDDDATMDKLSMEHIKKAQTDATVNEIKNISSMKQKIISAHVDAIKIKIINDAHISASLASADAKNKIGSIVTNDFSQKMIMYECKADMLDKFKVHTLQISDFAAAKVFPSAN